MISNIGIFASGGAAPPVTSYRAVASTVTSGNQVYASTLGLDFTVVSAITVTKLGVFSFDGNAISNGGAAGSGIRVGIYDKGASAFVADIIIVAADGAPSPDRFVYKAITPLSLPAGNYSIVTLGFSSSSQQLSNSTIGGGSYATVNTGGGLISFLYSGSYHNPYGTTGTWVYPSTPYSAAGVVFHAGSFIFN